MLEEKSTKKKDALLKSLLSEDQIETPTEKEIKEFYTARKVHEQDEILKQIQLAYDRFDQQLSNLEKERLEVVADSVYMDLFLLTLNHELIILKEYEETENQLRNLIKTKSKESDGLLREVNKIYFKSEAKLIHKFIFS